MIYLVVSITLILASVVLYARARVTGMSMTTSTYVIIGIFAVAGTVMTYVSLQEIDQEQYTFVQTMETKYPILSALVQESKPVIYRYEYLDILQEYRQLSKND